MRCYQTGLVERLLYPNSIQTAICFRLMVAISFNLSPLRGVFWVCVKDLHSPTKFTVQDLRIGGSESNHIAQTSEADLMNAAVAHWELVEALTAAM